MMASCTCYPYISSEDELETVLKDWEKTGKTPDIKRLRQLIEDNRLDYAADVRTEIYERME